MRVLGITETCDLGSLYLRLVAEGHEVRVTVSEPLAAGTMAGLLQRTEDWREELGWLREAGPEGFILFEAVGFGALQDDLRRQGFNVIGGSAFGDRLENDRAFALELLAKRELLSSRPDRVLARAEEALANLRATPAPLCVQAQRVGRRYFVGTLRTDATSRRS